MTGGRSSKVKGTRVEREVINQAKTTGLEAKRTWGSDGRSAGEVEAVDVIIENMKFQVKARHRLPRFLSPEEGTDGYIFREDNRKAVVVITYEQLLQLLKLRKAYLRFVNDQLDELKEKIITS